MYNIRELVLLGTVNLQFCWKHKLSLNHGCKFLIYHLNGMELHTERQNMQLLCEGFLVSGNCKCVNKYGIFQA